MTYRSLASSSLSFSLLFLLLSALPASARSGFDEVIDRVVRGNSRLVASAQRSSSELAAMKSENYLEAPEVEVESLWGRHGVGDKRNISVSQSFDWPGVYAARRDAIRAQSQVLTINNIFEHQSLRMEVRLLLTDIIYARQRMASLTLLNDGMAKIETAMKQAAQAGDVTRLDYNKAVIERVNTQRELRTLRIDYEELLTCLKTLYGGEVDELIELLGEDYPAVELTSLRPDYDSICAKDPAVRLARETVRLADANAKVARRSKLPGFSVGYIHEWEAGEVFNGFSLSLSLPFLYGGNKKKVAAAEMEALAAKTDERLAVIEQVYALEGWYRRAEELKGIIDDYQGVICDNVPLTLLEKAYAGGEINFHTYLGEVNFFLSARKDFLETLYQYNLALARLQIYR